MNDTKNLDTKTNWIEITKAVLGNKIENVRLIKGIVNNNFDMTLLPETIGLLHLDLPKDAKTIQPILKGAFPKLSKGSIIAFQDYAYQFSNELISLFELLEQLGYIKAVNIAASSMFFEVQNDYSLSRENLDSILQKAVDNQTNLIQNAIQKSIQNFKFFLKVFGIIEGMLERRPPNLKIFLKFFLIFFFL